MSEVVTTGLFFVVILLSHIIHGITGFAGTLLAMPFAIELVGIDVARPVLNVLAIFSGFYVLVNNYKYVNHKELRKIVLIMLVGIFSGIYIKFLFVGNERVLMIFLGIFIIYLSIKGLFIKKKEYKETSAIKSNALLVFAGIVHGIFVAGGPILIGYLSEKIKDKTVFRATISTVWIFLNTVILADDIRMGLWDGELLKILAIGTPILFGGMFIGTKLYHKMNQETFMKITYILLFIAGVITIF